MSAALFRCYAAIIASWMCYMGIGLSVGYPSTALPDIETGKYGFTFSGKPEEALWVSCKGIACSVGSLMVAPLMDKYGRKICFLFYSTLWTVGWLCTTAATSSAWLFVGRVLVSIATGAQAVIGSVYLAELTPKSIRGNAMSGNSTTMLFGIAMSYVFGTFMSWRYLAVIGIGNSLLASVLGYLFLPETPRWLIGNGDRDIAKENLRKLRDHDELSKEAELEAEMKEMEDSHALAKSETYFSVLKKLVQPPLLQPFLISNFLMFFQQFSATGYIKSFTVKIFQMSSGTKNSMDNGNSVLSNPHYQTIIIGFCGVLGGLFALLITDRLGRRVCLLGSGFFILIANTALGTYFWLHNQDPQWAVDTLGWLPLTCLVVFNISYGIGIGPVPYILMSELFPTRVRSIASGMAYITHSISFFLVAQIFGGLPITNYEMFWFYAGINFATIVFTFFFVPETKGRSLENIETLWGLHEVDTKQVTSDICDTDYKTSFTKPFRAGSYSVSDIVREDERNPYFRANRGHQ